MAWKKEKRRGLVPCVRLLGNLRIGKQNVLLMIGNVVSVPVITATLVFNYIHINVKASLHVNM
jgi:uncharacterized membrane protein